MLCFLLGQRMCSKPHVLNAQATKKLTEIYHNEEYVSFRCKDGYEFVGKYYTMCKDGTWDLLVCKRECFDY